MDEQTLYDIYRVGQAAMLSIAVASLAILVIKKSTTELRMYKHLFIIYLSLVLVQAFVSLYYEFVLDMNYFVSLAAVSANLFTLFEFCLFSFFFLRIAPNNLHKKIIITNLCLFLGFCGIAWFVYSDFSHFPHGLTVIEALIMIGYCLIYFLYHFRFMNEESNSSQRFAFLIVSGMLVYFVCLIPAFLILEYVPAENWLSFSNLSYINFISCSFLYITIVKAFKWKISMKAS